MWLTPHFPDLCWGTCIYTYTPPVAPAYPSDYFICAHSGVRHTWWGQKQCCHSPYTRNCPRTLTQSRCWQVLCNQLPTYMVMIMGRCGKWRRVARPMHIMTYPPPNVSHHHTTLIAPQNPTPPFMWSFDVYLRMVLIYSYEWTTIVLVATCEWLSTIEPHFSLSHAVFSSMTSDHRNIYPSANRLECASTCENGSQVECKIWAILRCFWAMFFWVFFVPI